MGNPLNLADALLEIGTEEIPASYLPPALEFMRSFCQQYLREKALSVKEISVFGTPRRLALILSGISSHSEAKSEEKMGPSLKAAKDVSGNWADAAKGFAAKCKVSVDALEIRSTPKGEYLCAVKKIGGIKAEEILKTLFLEMLAVMPFPKKMVWNESGFKFARPIRNIVALLNQKVLPLTVAGVRSTNKTFSLSPLSAMMLKIRSPKDYIRTLKNHCILVDPEERKKAIQHSLQQTARRLQGQVQMDSDLLEEVVWLVEHPTCVVGEFDPNYLSLPAEVLTTCMKKQQKFFSILKDEKLLPYFIGIRNGISENQMEVKKGYEKVLSARLSDANFFYSSDMKKTIQSHIQKAGAIQLPGKLGTIQDKIQRNLLLVRYLKDQLQLECDFRSLERVVALSKFDLATNMVYEFPELQGVVGEIYALAYGENKQVASAIREHYYPLTNQSELPSSAESSLASVADKMDSLISQFFLGNAPSGNSDPYGMRRQATGILRILLSHQWNASLKELCGFALKQLGPSQEENILQSSLNFFLDRFQLLMQDEDFGFAADEIMAVVKNVQDWDAQNLRIVSLKDKIKALHQARQHPEFEALSIAFKRACNILKQAKNKGIEFGGNGLHQTLLQQEEEKELEQAIAKLKAENDAYIKEGKYLLALQRLITVKPALDHFFEKVLVMDRNPEICRNRLSLLACLESNFKNIADFSLLQNRETHGPRN